MESRGRWLTSLDALGRALDEYVQPGDIVLLKGSRGLELERLLPRLTDSKRGVRC
jgi:UDP-N-acetylmuramyl pentapeptide synthase